MKDLTQNICSRTESMNGEIQKNKIPKKYNGTFNSGMNLSQQSKKLIKNEKYYSAASRCFGANVYFREILYGIANLSDEEVKIEVEKIKVQINKLDSFLNKTKINNLGDLEAVMIIKERLYDGKKNLEDNSSSKISSISYALERTYSSYAWQKFLGFRGKEIDEAKLKESCTLKINEVQELYNYVSIYMPSLLKDIKKELDSAREYAKTNDFILCLFKTSKSEAEVNAALSALYIQDSSVKPMLQNKILAAKKQIQKQVEKGSFPILGYSYYEYATTLNKTDSYTALLYAEYGIELSNLDIYFPMRKPFGLKIDEKALVTLILGFTIGTILFLIRKQYRRKKIVLRRKRH